MYTSQNLFHLPSNANRQNLQRYLQDCLLQENYDIAASIRDKLRSIEHLEGKRVSLIVHPGDRNRDNVLLKREFPIRLSLCRQDFIHPTVGMSQFDALRLTDADLRRISCKMADTFRDDLFWASLKTIVDSVLNNR